MLQQTLAKINQACVLHGLTFNELWILATALELNDNFMPCTALTMSDETGRLITSYLAKLVRHGWLLRSKRRGQYVVTAKTINALKDICDTLKALPSC